jgi:hypothetical protein
MSTAHTLVLFVPLVFLPLLLLFRRVLFEGLLDHVVQLAFELGRVAFFFSRNSAPDERSGAGVAQIDYQAAFCVRNLDDTSTETAPSGRIPLDFRFACRTEPELNIEVGPAGYHRQAPCRQSTFDIGADTFPDQFTVQSRVFAVQLALTDAEGFVCAEISGLVEFDGHFLGKDTAGGQQNQDEYFHCWPLYHTGVLLEDHRITIPTRAASISTSTTGTRPVAPRPIAPSMMRRLVKLQPALLMIPASTITKIPHTARPNPRTNP